MEQSVEKFDPSKLMDGVRDRVKATFVSLIPDDQWEKLVEKEVNAFFETKVPMKVTEETRIDGSWWGTKYLVVETEQTPFRAIVWQYCKDMTYSVLKEHITKEFFNNTWNPSPENISEGMKKMVEETAPQAMLEFFKMTVFSQMPMIVDHVNRQQSNSY